MSNKEYTKIYHIINVHIHTCIEHGYDFTNCYYRQLAANILIGVLSALYIMEHISPKDEHVLNHMFDKISTFIHYEGETHV